MPPASTPRWCRRNAGRGNDIGTLTVATRWDGTNAPVMSCALLTDNAGQQPTLSLTATTQPAAADQAVTAEARVPATGLMGMALLDLSTNVDLFGVAIAPLIGEYALDGGGGGREARASLAIPASGASASKAGAAPAFALEGMSLAFNGADVATFAVPQVSWEAMESDRTADRADLRTRHRRLPAAARRARRPAACPVRTAAGADQQHRAMSPRGPRSPHCSASPSG